jgi:CO/xanthine dehydrogenase Mo-binding subunit
VIGHAARPPLAATKATGSGRFPPDHSDGALHAALLLSDLPHAVITSLDLDEARRSPGVAAVLGRKDLGMDDTVRHVGDVVAAVAAETPELAGAALTAIDVAYRRLPVVVDAGAALEPTAPLIDTDRDSNLALQIDHDQGDVDAALAGADVVLEATYRTGRPTHCNLSPRSCTVVADHGVKVLCSVDAPHFAQRELAHALGLDQNEVRIVVADLPTSSFGGRTSINRCCEPVAARLAMATPGVPVRLTYDPTQEFIAGTTRHAVSARLVAGATSAGRLVALDVDLLADHGPYDTFVNRIVLGAGRDRALDLFALDNYRYRGRAMLTNNLMAGEMRGIGATQINFILGSHMDELALRLGLDPVDFLAMNLPEAARSASAGGLDECLRRGAEEFGWGAETVPTGHGRRGVGVGIGTHTTGLGTFHGPDTASARITVEGGTSVTVAVAAPDSGQGSSTTFAQIAAEELGVAVEAVRYAPIDTETTPEDPWGSVASRGTFVVGAAVRKAAIEARRHLLEAAAARLDVDGGDLEVIDGTVGVAGGGPSVAIDELAEHTAIRGQGTVVSNRTPPTYGAYFAEVDVDPETGVVRVERLVAALDVGFAVHPAHCRGQIEGAIGHGIEFALGAEVVMRDGRPENPSMVDYRLARTVDMPRIEVILVEGGDETGPYGALGIGTPSLTPVLPAVANAVRNAVGERLGTVPMWPEAVWTAIRSVNQ